MRNEKLKNELNQIPQDFDREVIWAGIELPQKKRRSRRFFWLFLTGGLVFGILLFTIFLLNNEKQNSFAEKHQAINNKYDDKTGVIEKDQERFSENTSEKNQILSVPQIINNSEKIASNNIERIKKGDEEKSNGTVEISTANLINKSSIAYDENKSTFKPKDIEQTDLSQSKSDTNNSSASGLSYENINNLNPDHLTPSVPLQIDKRDKFDVIPLLPHIAFEFLELDEIKLYRDVKFSTLNSHHNKPNLFSLSIFSHIGKSSHDFSGPSNSNYRKNSEKSLESINVGVIGQIHLKNFEVFTGVSITRHNTHLTESIQEFYIIDHLQSLVQREVNTQYSLYNSYQYIDILVGLGYDLSLARNWSLAPSIQIGYSVNFNPAGEILNQDNHFVELSSLSEYRSFSKWQGQANLKVARRINENWEMGLHTFLTSNKRLGSFEDYTHSVSTYGGGLSITRFIR